MRTKMSATCSASTEGAISSAVKGHFCRSKRRSRLWAISFFLVITQRCLRGQLVDKVIDELAAGFPRYPYVGNAGYPLRVAANSGVSDLKAPIAWPEGNLDLPLPIIIVQNLASPKHGIKRGQALLTVDDEAGGCMPLLAVGTDLTRSLDLGVLPKQEISDGKPAIPRIEQVADFCVRPHEGALDIRQANVTDIDIVEQPGEIVINALETRFQLTHTPSPTNFSAS
jgi:hypothetical protein